MAVIRDTTNVGIGAVIPNQIAGSPFEILAGPNQVQIAMVAGAGDLIANITFGGRIIADQMSIPLEPAAGTGPNINENLVVNDTALAGERIVIRLTGGAGAVDVRTLVNLSPL